MCICACGWSISKKTPKITEYSCWFFIPIWKICASQIGSSPQIKVYKNKTHLKLPPGHSFVRHSPFRNIITRWAPTGYKDMTLAIYFEGSSYFFPVILYQFFSRRDLDESLADLCMYHGHRLLLWRIWSGLFTTSRFSSNHFMPATIQTLHYHQKDNKT